MIRKEKIEKSYDDLISRKRLFIIITGLLILLLIVLGLALGPSSIKFKDIVSIIRGEGDEIQRNMCSARGFNQNQPKSVPMRIRQAAVVIEQ